LIHLLPDYHFPRQGIYAVYPDARHVSTKVRAFIDFLRSQWDCGEHAPSS
ncbi:LysR family transcriptional regulator, partial [Salmonella enterica subsp. enterica serovar Infantis]|nr:LysR family transcriptional regulator [Salmonella enterica subsp. enterica serovar Isangi]